ncbi:putative glycosyltransferase [Apostasia shenzhenica]|uniref:Putative glycosyltransferase n=1 Tax=Apostasia shenzhenica TaxID=1088818 RepID=A0A2H9ZVF1_9ASPA|nr:putative glycosyltransferase [Apostasia shenzhenica]
MDDYVIQSRTSYRFGCRKLLFLISFVFSMMLVFRSFMLPFTSVLLPVRPSLMEKAILSHEEASREFKRLGVFSLLSESKNLNNTLEILKELDPVELNNVSGRTGVHFRDKQVGLAFKKGITLADGIDLAEIMESKLLNDSGDQVTRFIRRGEFVDKSDISSTRMANEDFAFENSTNIRPDNAKVFNDEIVSALEATPAVSSNDRFIKEALVVNLSNIAATSLSLVVPTLEGQGSSMDSPENRLTKNHLTNGSILPSPIRSTSLIHHSKDANSRLRTRKGGRPPISVTEMNRILSLYHSSYHRMKSWRHSAPEKQLSAARALLEKPLDVKITNELYEPAFWNISKFKRNRSIFSGAFTELNELAMLLISGKILSCRSYELMGRILKIYVYKEGNKPVFHQPLLRGIYASEGWLMKLLQTDKHYVVKDPRKAHLFYMPFSSRLLQIALYVPNSRSHRNLVEHLKNYVDMIAAKYPYWNKTGGANHFFAACHDWAPRITASAMEPAIRALCNADLRRGFQLGKDVSLPEIYIRSARNPLRDLGGNPAKNRSTLAFYAGNMHGRLRSILLQHWENKDPDMKIFGPMPPGVESKMNYIQHMKTSKYCICPRGYEVNSPRVIESFYYECVPVIISDNYVPPLFEVLNWETFSVIIAEHDVPRLKEILVSIPEERYRLLQMGVRKVQQHFLWHSKPLKYDLFHMILHSIWYNRLHQVGIR